VYLVVLPQARWQTSPESPCPLKRLVGRSTWRPTTLRPAGALSPLPVVPVRDNQPCARRQPLPSRRRCEVFEPPSPPPQVGDLRAEGGAAAIMSEAAAARRTCGPTACFWNPAQSGPRLGRRRDPATRGAPPPPAGPDVVVGYGSLDIMCIFAELYLQNSYAGCLQM